jgi:oxygen-dependent protoporphyrinogen oxidase
MNRIVIVGGGIAGLAAAYYATKRLAVPKEHRDDVSDVEEFRDIQITLIESSNHWGGKICTDRVAFDDGADAFIIEGGPDTFLATKPWGVALCKELALGDRLHGTNPHKKNTYVLNKGRLLPLPDGLAMMIPTNVQAILKSGLVSWFSKARMGLDFLIPAKIVSEDESLGTFVSRRLGREAYENLIEPLMSGIYAGDGDQLSLASTFPYLRDLEVKYGSLARGALQMRKQSNGKGVQGSRSAFLTPTTGLAEIVEALVESLRLKGASLRLNTRVDSVHHLTPDTWHLTLDTGETLTADGLILATPAYITGKLLA